jgi:phosphatidylinositol glycan class B
MFGKEKIIYAVVIGIISIVYVVTAFNSHGYYHADEHYQIVEFAGIKLGTHKPFEVAWEYEEQVRPTVQPTICFLVIKMFTILDNSNPYWQMFCLRLLSAVLALTAIGLFVKRTINQFDNKYVRLGYFVLSYLLWFIPYLSVRFASESWSGLFFLLSLAVLLNNTSENRKKFFVAGILIGLAFLFRFQIASAVVGLCCWLFFIRKTKIRYFLVLFAAFLLVLLAGTCLDTWFYGRFVFTQWNYFHVNFIEDKASMFGTSPWYFYLLTLLKSPTYFVGIPVALSIVLLAVFQPKNVYLWCFIPFFVLHSFIPHKEERFLFPIVYLSPVILAMAYNQIRVFLQKRMITKVVSYVLLIAFAVVNLTGVVVVSQKGGGLARMCTTKYIYERYNDRSIRLIWTVWANPYKPWEGLGSKFYYPHDIEWGGRIEHLGELNDTLIAHDKENLLMIKKSDLELPDARELLRKNHYIFETQTIPTWMLPIINSGYPLSDNHIFCLYRYNPQSN